MPWGVKLDEGEGSSGDVYEFGHRPAQPEALSAVSTVLPSCSLGFSLESWRMDGWWEIRGRWMAALLVGMRTQYCHNPSPQLSSPGMMGKMRSPNLPHFPPQIWPQSSVVRPLLPPLTPGPRGNGAMKGELPVALRCFPCLRPQVRARSRVRWSKRSSRLLPSLPAP